MNGQTWYIDPIAGDDSRDGQSPEQAVRTYAQRPFAPGDTVLFKRGSVIRDILRTCTGDATGVVTYGAYGIGKTPVFLGSAPADGAENWIEERPNIWRFEGVFASEVCNLIFDDGASGCGNLRWELADLKAQGEWHYTGLGLTQGVTNSSTGGYAGSHLYLYSDRNPGERYRSIECALWGQRQMFGGNHHLTVENLAFRNSGVHGYQGVRASHITIRGCEFHFIGGACWSKHERIRFGNAVEFWDGALDIVVEDCVFTNIYDTGVTHQGGDHSDVPDRVYFRHNLFVDYGMAAYECRGPHAREVYFEYNTCINAGGGFSMQGEAPPRQSEIYPQPMGHHIFIWRIDLQQHDGRIYIRHNVFSEAPYGGAIYSVIGEPDERHLVLDYNCYWQTTGNLHALLHGRLYDASQFALYRLDCHNDLNSITADPRFIDAARGDYRLRADTPCPGIGMRRAPVAH